MAKTSNQKARERVTVSIDVAAHELLRKRSYETRQPISELASVLIGNGLQDPSEQGEGMTIEEYVAELFNVAGVDVEESYFKQMFDILNTSTAPVGRGLDGPL